MRRLLVVSLVLCVTLFPRSANKAEAFGPALLALNPTTLGALVAAGGVLAAGAALYAPAIHDAADLVVSQSGSIARKLWAVNTMIDFVETATGQYLYGKAVTAWGQVQGMIDYIKSLPNQFSSLISAIDAASQPQGSSVVQTGSIVYVPDVGWFQLGAHKSGIDRYCVSVTSLPGWNGYVVGGPWDYIAYFSGSGAVGFMAVAGDPGTAGCFSGDVPVDVDVWYSASTSPPPGVFDPAAFANTLDTSDPVVAAEVDALIQQRPDFWAVTDADVVSVSQQDTPPPVWNGYTPVDTVRELSYINADLASQVADNVTAIADASGDPALQVEALNAQLAADRAGLDALKSDLAQDIAINVDMSGVESRLDAIDNTLDDIRDSVVDPTATLPDINTYDATIDDPGDVDLIGAIESRINSLKIGDGFFSKISQLQIASSSPNPCLDIDIYGGHISSCIDEYQSFLNAIGAIILFCAYVYSAFIIVKGG